MRFLPLCFYESLRARKGLRTFSKSRQFLRLCMQYLQLSQNFPLMVKYRFRLTSSSGKEQVMRDGVFVKDSLACTELPLRSSNDAVEMLVRENKDNNLIVLLVYKT